MLVLYLVQVIPNPRKGVSDKAGHMEYFLVRFDDAVDHSFLVL